MFVLAHSDPSLLVLGIFIGVCGVLLMGSILLHRSKK